MKTFTEYLNEAKKELLHPEIKVGTIINVDFQHFYKIIKRTDKSVTYVEVEKENKHDKMTPIVNEIKKKAQPITINFAKSYVENDKKGFMYTFIPMIRPIRNLLTYGMENLLKYNEIKHMMV
jgi:hypothetical protein